jgi:replicative DNA helicase
MPKTWKLASRPLSRDHGGPSEMAPLPADLKAYREQLLRLLVWPEGQRWATQVDGENEYPHRRGPLQAGELDRHLLGHQTVALVPDGHGSLCRSGAVDLDLPRDGATLGELLELVASLQQAAAARDIPTLVVFSGRRGFHLLVPTVTPVAWSVMHRALRRICRDVGLEPAELFPSKGKALKLPGGRHRITGAWSVVLPPLAELQDRQKLLEALESHLEAAAPSAPKEPPEACSWAAQAALLAAFRPAGPQQLEEAAGEASSPDLELLEEGTHPLCIQTRLERGPAARATYGRALAVDQTLHGENLLLASYCSQRDIPEEQAEEMAATFHGLAPEGFTTKAPAAAAKDFRKALEDCSDPSRGLLFRCSNAVAGGPREAQSLVAAGLCGGEACPCWPWGKTSTDVREHPRDRKERFPQTSTDIPEESSWGSPPHPSEEGSLHGRRLWQAIQKVLDGGLEVIPSLVLAAAERIEPETGFSRPTALADEMAEAEFLRGCLASGGTQLLAGVVLHPAAFGCSSTLPWESWIQKLLEQPETSTDVWRAHLDRLADLAIRAQAKTLASSLGLSAENLERQPADTLADASQEVANLLRTVSPDLQPVRDQLEKVLLELVDTAAPRIPVFHPGLAQVLGGGLRPGQLVMAGGPPGCGKTTMALQQVDHAAAAGIPCLFISMEMTRTQLVEATLSRLSVLEAKAMAQALSKASGGDGQATEKAVAAAEEALTTYQQELAPNLYLVEGGPQHTPGRIQALVGQIRHQKGLPDTHPVLVVVDYLQLLSLGAEGEGNIREDLRVGALASALKGLARATGSAVLALSDITKQAMEEAEKGGRIGPGVFRDSGRILHAADTALVIQSGSVPPQPGKNGQKPKPARNLLEMALEEAGLSPVRRRQLEEVDRPLEHKGDTIARWTVIKNRGGQAGGEVWSLYRRHLHTYLPLLKEDGADQKEASRGW